MAYFRSLPNDTLLKGNFKGIPESKIIAGDLLHIIVSSLNKEEDLVYNAAGGQMLPSYLGEDNQRFAYLVDDAGYILFHQLGKVKAEGATRKQLQEKLQKNLLPFLKDPVVSVSFLNYRISVLGDVKSPQIINIPQERISIMDALAVAGDVNLTARTDNFLIIREQDSGRYMKRIDMKDNSMLDSEWFYLKCNDILYVSTDDDKRMFDERRTRFIQNFSIVLSSLSLSIVILAQLLN
jgi:polysaccharide export outer membrane protein